MQPHVRIVRCSFSLGWFLSSDWCPCEMRGHRHTGNIVDADWNDKLTSQGTNQDCWQSPPEEPAAVLGNKLQPDPGSSAHHFCHILMVKRKSSDPGQSYEHQAAGLSLGSFRSQNTIIRIQHHHFLILPRTSRPLLAFQHNRTAGRTSFEHIS